MAKSTYLRKFLENLDDIVFVIDWKSMTYKYISPAINSRGVTPEEVYVDPTIVYRMLDEDFRQDLLAKVQANINKGPLHFEYPTTIRSGEVKWYSSHIFLVDGSGDDLILAGIIRDITAQKQTELELEQLKLEYEDLYNHAPIGYHSLDVTGRIVRMNDTELEWLGYTREELMGQVFSAKVFTPSSQKAFQENFPKLKDEGKVNDLQFEMIRKDGSILDCLLNASQVKDEAGNFIKTRSIITDISEIKLAEERLKNKQLELEAVNEELRQTTMKLERLNFTKDVLLKIVSHDLRNPLVTINMISELLHDRYAEIDPETVLSYLTYINEASQQANNILNDLSSMVSLDSEDIQLEIRKKDLSELIEEAIGINARKAEEKGVHLYLAEGPNLHQLKAEVDAKWMVRALDNIIANAIKFSNKGGEVKIACRQAAQKVILSIADTGIGIPKTMLAKLFEKNAVMSRPGTAGETGTGLGLSIVKQILDMQLGDIRVKSKVGVGSTFEIRLPLAAY